VNCLNFGDPENPEVMWQLSQAIDGMSEACRALGLPVVGGNVSLYNASAGRDIAPTPVIGMLGLIDALDRRPPGATLVEGGRLLLLGDRSDHSLNGSRWASEVHGHTDGPLPALDFERHLAVYEAVRTLVAAALVQGAHDIADGGLALALAEMAVRSGTGFSVAGVSTHAELFSEAPSRVVVCVAPDRVAEVREHAEQAGAAVADIGVAGGDVLDVEGLLRLRLDAATERWHTSLPSALAGRPAGPVGT
jgi:phosphoribosylformylglycinamidine synthase